jgi:predicted metal-dependent hydrolase
VKKLFFLIWIQSAGTAWQEEYIARKSLSVLSPK